MDENKIIFKEVNLRKDLSGTRFGKLLVLNPVGQTKQRHTVYSCMCDCGDECYVTATHLSYGDTKSCGSCATHLYGTLKTTKKKYLYRVWSSMVQRCSDVNSTGYKNYGGRGITVCAEWEKSFEEFYKDMGDRPSKKHQIDREDNNKGYSKENCRWVTTKANCRNKRTNVFVSNNGETLTIAEWSERTGINYGTLRGRVARGWIGDKLFNKVGR